MATQPVDLRLPKGPAPSRRGPFGSPSPRTGDAAIRSTDDDAAISRASCASLGYLDDPFATCFLQSPTSSNLLRPTLINIGTFLRTWAVDRLLTSFLDAGGSSEDGPRQIISLGAGTDTRFFRLWRDRQAPKALVRYIEVDFPETTARKVKIIRSNSQLCACLGPEVRFSSDGAALSSPVYHLLPGDLREFTETLGNTLIAPLPDAGGALLRKDIPTLIIAECVFIYVPADTSAALLRWSTQTFDRVATVIYDPAGLNDSFGRMMVNNLKVSASRLQIDRKCLTATVQTRNIVLHGIEASPGPAEHPARFLRSGFLTAKALDMKSIRREHLPRSELDRISRIEMLDELEELDLVLNHYVIAWATKDESGLLSDFGLT